MPNIKFPGLYGGDYTKLTITQSEHGCHYKLNDFEIPNVDSVKLIALDSVPRVEITVIVNEVDGAFNIALSE